MSVRRGEIADEAAVADLCAQAFWSDELLGVLMHPHRNEYPDDFNGYFRRRFRKSVGDPSHCVMVSTWLDQQGHEVVTGYADWVRQRGGDDDPLAATTDNDSAQNRAADLSQIDIFERAGPFVKHYWSGNRAETWLLDVLAIHPTHQRKGYGKALVLEGVKLAEKDHVCASVIASPVGDKFYVSCGFEPVGWASEGEGNPLRDVPGGRILFRDF